MKPLVLALNVVLFATLLNLVSAGTEVGSNVLASYKEYTLRQFPRKIAIACVEVRSWNNLDEAKKSLQSIAGGNNDERKTVALGKGGVVMFDEYSIAYCKFVPGGSARRFRLGKNGKKIVRIGYAPTQQFYAMKASNESPAVMQATAAKVAALVVAENNPRKRIISGSYIVEITEAGEIYAGVVGRKSGRRNK